MELNFDVLVLINILGFFQGLILAIILIILNSNKKPSLFLGFFVLAFSLGLTRSIIAQSNLLQYYPYLQLFPTSNLESLMAGFFYLYVHKISIFSSRQTNYKLLIPGIFILLIDVVLFVLQFMIEEDISNMKWYRKLYSVENIFGFFFSVTLIILAYRYLKKHLAVVKNQFATIEFINLRWLLGYIYVTLLHAILSTIAFFLDVSNFMYYISAIINIALLYWISIKGVLQKEIKPLLPLESKKENKAEIISKKDKEVLLRLADYINDYEVYKKTDLTIIDVANMVNEHPKRISGIINSCLKQNFNTYINSFRVEKAKELLSHNSIHNFSIEGISIEVGFHSRSAFYEAFKKETGTTPSRYQKKNQNFPESFDS